MRSISIVVIALSSIACAQETRDVLVGYQSRDVLVGKKHKQIAQPVNATLDIQRGRLLAVQPSSYYAGANTQYYYVSPACLNTWWCHILAGDPSATTEFVYGTAMWFVVQGPEYTYVAYSTELASPQDFTINGNVAYGLYGSRLYIWNDLGYYYALTIYQKAVAPQPAVSRPSPPLHYAEAAAPTTGTAARNAADDAPVRREHRCASDQPLERNGPMLTSCR
jgi:hypothetical protein